jgi:DNA-binding sugar fermentation-stimulating protein
MSLLISLSNLIEATVIKRPSKIIKSPYVSDLKLENDVNEHLGHSPSLGCCGLADNGRKVLVQFIDTSKNKSKKDDTKLKCEYRIYCAIHQECINEGINEGMNEGINEGINERINEEIIGIYPKLAEELFENALNKNLISKLMNIKEYKRETKIFIEGHVDSRFDFSGIDENGTKFILEVKNVPLADYEDLPSKERKKMDFSDREFNSKVAYFPDGYRKTSKEPISVRAIKHLENLTYLKNLHQENIRCLICFVIQRNDVERFQPSVIDPQYIDALKNAHNNGVEIIALKIRWDREGNSYFVSDNIPINI